jgi:hypothetical protein
MSLLAHVTRDVQRIPADITWAEALERAQQLYRSLFAGLYSPEEIERGCKFLAESWRQAKAAS